MTEELAVVDQEKGKGAQNEVDGSPIHPKSVGQVHNTANKVHEMLIPSILPGFALSGQSR